MKRALFFMLLIILFSVNISALIITEVELNPEGTDSGNEWIELYSEKEINLENYSIINNDGDELFLNGSFFGYIIYVFSEGQWLDNSDEKIELYNNSEKIQETIIFEDNENTIFTWQLCENDWVFQEQTPEEKCVKIKDDGDGNTDEQNPGETDEIEEEQDKEEEKEVIEVIQIDSGNETSENNQEIIMLGFNNSKDIKTNSNTELGSDEKSFVEDYPLYVFMAFCVLIIGLFSAKKFGKRKNEFR